MSPAAATSARSMRPRVPGRCEVCRSWGDAGAVCVDCVARYATPLPRCRRCGLRLGAAAPRCGECLRDPPPFDRTVCAADYGYPWDRLVGAFKFQDRPELATALAARIAAAVRDARVLEPEPLPQLLLAVPLAARRLAERGYNQAWELARRCAAVLGLHADPLLLQRPVAAAADQTELGRDERRRALQGAFMVDPRRRAAVQGLRVALVDDVMTTGATARAATTVLRRAGASAVEVWVLARTPAD